MFLDLLSRTIGDQRAADLLGVLALDERLDPAPQDTVPPATIAGVLHFLLFEELLKRAPTALTIAGEAMAAGERMHLDHAAMATLDGPYTGGLLRGRHHLGQVLEPLGFVQAEAHAIADAQATAHIYRHQALPDAVPDFVVLEVHVTRFEPPVQAAVRAVFGEAPSPNHVRVQSLILKAREGEGLNMDEAAELLRGLFAWFGRQHVPPLKSDYQRLSGASHMLAWMAHEGQGLSHMSVRVPHLSACMDAQLREERLLQPVRTSLDQSIKLVGLVPDMGSRAFRSSDGGVEHADVPIANLAFIERADEEASPRFEPSLF